MRAPIAIRVSSLLALGAGLVACDQPSPKCGIARGTFSARYTLVAGSKLGEGDCDSLLGDELAVQAYNQKRSNSAYADPNHVQIGIQPSSLTNAVARAQTCGMDNMPGLAPYSLGAFKSSKPDKDDFCDVPTLTPSRVALPEQDGCSFDDCQPPLSPEPAADYTYEWSNVHVYVTAGANGTQFSADLKYTKDGCSAQYKVVALYPSVSCAAPSSTGMSPATGDDASTNEGGGASDAGLGGMDGSVGSIDGDATITSDAGVGAEDDASGEWVKPDGCDPDPEPVDYVPSDFLCSQDAPITGGPSGTNINPDFMVQCDAQQLRCVLSGDPPSLR